MEVLLSYFPGVLDLNAFFSNPRVEVADPVIMEQLV
jgi:hypothetical protein